MINSTKYKKALLPVLKKLKDIGETMELEDGMEFVFEMNNAIVLVELEDDGMSVKVIHGSQVYKVDADFPK